MKRLWTLILICVAMETSGQEIDAKGNSNIAYYEKGSHYLAAGYGFIPINQITLLSKSPNVPLFKGVTGPIYFKYEYRSRRIFSMGISLAYIHHDFKSYDYLYEEILTAYSALLRFNWHFSNENGVISYFGTGIGFQYFKMEERVLNIYNPSAAQAGSEDEPVDIGLGLEITYGVNYSITPALGAFVEIGFAKSLIKAGMIYKI